MWCRSRACALHAQQPAGVRRTLRIRSLEASVSPPPGPHYRGRGLVSGRELCPDCRGGWRSSPCSPVRSEITRCRGKIKKATEDLKEEKLKLESKVQQFSEKSFLLKILKTHENALERQCSEITNQRDTLLQAFEDTKKKVTEEEEKFIKEITDFNDEYEITKKRDIVRQENIKKEISDLEKQANVLRGEMKSMECSSGHLQELQKQKSQLLQELFTLQEKLKVLKDEEIEAIYTTKYLEAEKTKVKEKPQHDAECLRLKQELDLYNEDEMESAWKELQAETEFLELTLAQKGLQDKQPLEADELPHA
ncbi:coiled-coil domain-containing protein 172 isoform X1 [Cricetulus griseus]|uniref:coiled-coil domain-containing protein 172 isoform X1 n=1 Tax=Cricetulus griseus TaxID=10029 RepID=UPI0015C38549|nr:coiled-coil domain-containing protein 172 isoform X1 [Cricetulus griseus]